MRKLNRVRPHHVGPHRKAEFPDLFRYPQDYVRTVHLDAFDQEISRFTLMPTLEGSLILVPPADKNNF